MREGVVLQARARVSGCKPDARLVPRLWTSSRRRTTNREHGCAGHSCTRQPPKVGVGLPHDPSSGSPCRGAGLPARSAAEGCPAICDHRGPANTGPLLQGRENQASVRRFRRELGVLGDRKDAQDLALDPHSRELRADQVGRGVGHVDDAVPLVQVDRADDPGRLPGDARNLADEVRRRDEMLAADIHEQGLEPRLATGPGGALELCFPVPGRGRVLLRPFHRIGPFGAR